MHKNIIIGILVVLGGVLSIFGWGHNNSYPVFYDKNGQTTVNQIKIWSDTVSATSALDTINISSASFSAVKSAIVTAQYNTSSIASMALIEIKSVTTTSVIVNIITQNNSTVSILGINVLSGTPLAFASSPSGIILNVEVKGY